MFLKNCWYVGAWSQEVTAERPLERTILAESLLFWRKSDGTAVAMNNRCPHRQAPLSLGRIDGDEVQCMYHGLRFGDDGQCRYIPGQAVGPASPRARVYPLVEKGAWIWVWMGDPASADADLIPDTLSLTEPGWRYKPGGHLHYKADYRLIADNLLDFSHLSYVHENTLGGSALVAETHPRVEPLPRGVRVTRDVRNIPTPPHILKLRNGVPSPEGCNRLFVYDFVLPSVLLMHSVSKSSATADDDLDGACVFHSCQALTPESEHTSHYFFMQANNFDLENAAIPEKLYELLLEAFEEDRRMIEAQQALILRCPPQPMGWVQADAALGRFRRLLEQEIAKEAAAS